MPIPCSVILSGQQRKRQVSNHIKAAAVILCRITAAFLLYVLVFGGLSNGVRESAQKLNQAEDQKMEGIECIICILEGFGVGALFAAVQPDRD